MDGDVLDSLPVDPDLAPIAYALDVLLGGERPRACRGLSFRSLGLLIGQHGGLPRRAWVGRS